MSINKHQTYISKKRTSMRKVFTDTIHRARRNIITNREWKFRLQADVGRRYASAVEQLLEDLQDQLVDPLLLLVAGTGIVVPITQMRDRVRTTPTKKFTGVLRTNERDDGPKRAQVPRLPSGLEIQLADVQKRHQVDDTPPHRWVTNRFEKLSACLENKLLCTMSFNLLMYKLGFWARFQV